jgi:hypothetical protein
MNVTKSITRAHTYCEDFWFADRKAHHVMTTYVCYEFLLNQDQKRGPSVWWDYFILSFTWHRKAIKRSESIKAKMVESPI